MNIFEYSYIWHRYFVSLSSVYSTYFDILSDYVNWFQNVGKNYIVTPFFSFHPFIVKCFSETFHRAETNFVKLKCNGICEYKNSMMLNFRMMQKALKYIHWSIVCILVIFFERIHTLCHFSSITYVCYVLKVNVILNAKVTTVQWVCEWVYVQHVHVQVSGIFQGHGMFCNIISPAVYYKYCG